MSKKKRTIKMEYSQDDIDWLKEEHMYAEDDEEDEYDNESYYREDDSE